MTWLANIGRMDRAVQGNLGGVPVVYAPAVGSPVTVLSMHDQHQVTQTDGPAGVERVYDSVFLLLADLPAINPLNDNPRLTVEGKSYRVRERRLDNAGGITLFLTPVSP
jgi:hypothetical protein